MLGEGSSETKVLRIFRTPASTCVEDQSKDELREEICIYIVRTLDGHIAWSINL